MAQIFRKSSNSFARASLVGAFVFFFGFWGIVYAVYRSPYTTDVNVPLAQPAPFSHQHHVAGLGLHFRDFHTSVENSAFSGLPTTETLMALHSQGCEVAPEHAPL